MTRFLSWIDAQRSLSRTRSLPALAQGVLHVVAIYIVARICAPWLANLTHNTIYPLLFHRPMSATSWQFGFSHLFVLSFLPALLVGFVNEKLLPHRIVLLAWVIPATMLTIVLVLFVSTATGLFIENDIKEALRYYFSGGFVIPAEFQTRRELLIAFKQNPDMARGWAQLRFTGPLYAGVAYSLGALLSVYWKKLRPALGVP
jgi:hypothetical protein